MDTTDPVVVPPAAITIECDESTDPNVNTALGLGTATDNCDANPTVTFSDNFVAACGATGTITRDWTATDACGNTHTLSQTITVVDTTPPVISGCPTDITVTAAAGQCSAVVNWTPPTATDNCGTPTITSTHNPGDTFLAGETTVTYTVDDGCNQVTCQFGVIVDADWAGIDCYQVGVSPEGCLDRRSRQRSRRARPGRHAEQRHARPRHRQPR